MWPSSEKRFFGKDDKGLVKNGKKIIFETVSLRRTKDVSFPNIISSPLPLREASSFTPG
jgi:hypothetical protein